ncbi:MAG TPA: ADOP family duplicated permease [Bryobacteraceae bacterium]|nr:ADOP family duplicated permease [Bryobacteraceae bacterium]
MADPKRIYRFLLRLYPARFREEYAAPVERQFWDDYRALSGFWPRAWFWLSALADLGVSIPTEILRELRQDGSYALRLYGRRRMVTLLAMAALALAIGAATGIFSVVNAVLLRSLPFREPDRLVEVWRAPANGLAGRAAFQHWRDTNGYLETAAAYTPFQITLQTGRDSFRVQVAEVSANFFSMLGTPPEFGRDFRPEEDQRGNTHVAILSHALWDQAFGGDPRILGKTILLNGAPVQVVGVAPPAVEYPAGTALWTPSAFDLKLIPKLGVMVAYTAGRLRPGISLRQAQAMLQADIAAHVPHSKTALPEPDPAALIPLRDRLSERIRQASLVLLGAVGFVLLIACANLAHLLLTRSTERRQELSIRAALGASRARLLQQLITEGFLLTTAAALAGIVVARWAAQLAGAALPAQLASQVYTVFDWRVLAFAALAAVGTGLVFAVVPATVLGRLQPKLDNSRNEGAASAGAARLRAALVAFQALLTVVLLAGSFVMGRGFLRLIHTDLGFTTSRVLTLNVSLAGTSYEKSHNLNAYAQAALDRLRDIPGVQSAGASEIPPFSAAARKGGKFTTDSGFATGLTQVVSVTPDYFRTIGQPLAAGRDFDPADQPTAPRVAIVSESVARALGGPTAALGQQLSAPYFAVQPWTIVGVAADIRFAGPSGGHPLTVYVPAAQAPPGFLTFAVKVHGSAAPYLTVCRDVLRDVDRAVPVYGVQTLDSQLAGNLAQPRFYTAVATFFGAFSLLLAVIAIYGTASYSIQQRRHEIGVRAAMGASPRGMRLMLLREAAVPIALGIAAGAMGASSLGRAAQALIPVAEPPGAPVCAGTALLLAATAIAATWIATRGILKLDPMAVLRAD